MNGPRSCLYVGEVVHKRLAPLRHELRYRVVDLFVDIDELPHLSHQLLIFGHNRHALVSVHDRDHGDGSGAPLRPQLERLTRTLPEGADVKRFFMFCYPRVMGYVFNPLTVYYGYDDSGRLRLMIYEVNNTSGGRHAYVLPYSEEAPQRTHKRLYVSPFNAVAGDYGFHVSVPDERLAIGITLTTASGPVMKAYFAGRRQSLTTANLMWCFIAMPLQSLKVIGAIHWQALKLWLKGLRTVPRPPDAATFRADQRRGNN